MHATPSSDVNIRFVSSTTSFASSSGHQVRTLTERSLCDWLTQRRIAHHHASEVLIVRTASNGAAAMFVPDIVLMQKASDGRTIIIESLHSFAPKRGGLKTLSAFRKQYGDQFVVIVVGKKATLSGIPKNISDARIEFESLELLEKKIKKLLATT